MRSAVKRKEPSVSGFEIYISVMDERMFEPLMRKRMISRFVEEVFCADTATALSEDCAVAGCAASVFVSSSFLDNSFSFSIICERRT